MNNLGQYLNLIVIVLVVAFSALGWLMRTLREQKELRRSEIERQRRRDEALRTGRLNDEMAEPSPMMPSRPGSEQPDPGEVKRRLQELADRRRRELEELRRRAKGGAPAPDVVLSPAPVQSRPVPAAPRPVPVGPVADPTRSAQSGAELERRRRAAAERAAREKAQKQAADRRKREEALEKARQRQAAQAEEQDSGAPASVAMVARADAESRAAATRAATSAALLAAGSAVPPSIDSPEAARAWRNAIVLMEVMSAPTCLRSVNERVI